MATHSSVLAWRIPGTGESGGLPFLGVAQSRTRLKRLSSSRRTLIKALLKPGEYLQWMMWFYDIARDDASRNARAGAPPNQITFEMLTGTGQFVAIEAQIQCLPLLHEQLKTVALEAWDRITPQGEPTGSYTKILQGPNETYADFLPRFSSVQFSRSVVSDSMRPHESQHARPPCPSPTPGLHSDSQDFSRGRLGGLLFPSLKEFSTVYCDPHSQRLWYSQ